MEPGVKLFPAVFVEATSKDVLQIELGRTPTSLPLSAAVLQSSEKHVVPQVGWVDVYVDFFIFIKKHQQAASPLIGAVMS